MLDILRDPTGLVQCLIAVVTNVIGHIEPMHSA